MTLAPGLRTGPYEITGPLGEGGMGVVWRARDTSLDRDVAIKVLPEAFAAERDRLARFDREARLLAQLNHPNVAQVYGVVTVGETRALVLELVAGPTLEERLSEGPLPVDESLAIARQMAEALEEAHEKGIVHRDLKPANVKVTPDGRVKVLDFGLAKALDPGAGGSTTDLRRSPTMLDSPTLTAMPGTQIGVILGTAAYMAPEQAKGKPVDRRADIWAFGVVLFEMLSGRRLFDGETVSEVLAAVIREEVEWGRLPADTPPAVRRLLRRCLERDPRQRLRDVGEARIALAAGAGEEGESPARAPGAPSSRRSERFAWALAAASAVVAVGLAAAWATGRGGDARAAAPRVIRSVLPLPPGVSIELDGERAGMPALSHDGRRVAFGAREGAGPMRIWVQELATGSARPLPGTEGGYRPFWSPDDRAIGFFTWSHLATTPADGGAVRRLAPARDARGGTWNRAGTILYAPHQYGPLYAIPEQGGPPRPATALGGPARSGTHRFPSFLPDGERFLFLERLDRFGPGHGAAVRIGRLGSPDSSVELLAGATNAVLADGHLLFARDGALVAQRLDPRRQALAGEARPLVTDLLFNLRFSYGVFSAGDHGILAFLTGRQSDLSQLVWRDRTGRHLGTLGAPGILSGIGGLALSRDGRRAAVSRIEPGTSEADIWLHDLVRGRETRLARPGTDDSNPVFSPDGSVLYFASFRDAAAEREPIVVRRDLTTGEETVLASGGPGYLLPMSASPDGAWLAYDRGDDERVGWFDVVLHPLGGEGAARPLVATRADDSSGQVSPDGRWVAWSSDASGQHEVYVMPFPQGGTAVQVSRAGGAQPRWNPAGGELFFKAPDNTLTAVPFESASATFSVGTPLPLFRIVEFFGWTYDVSPDGQRFLVREPLVEANASPITLLTDWQALVETP